MWPSRGRRRQVPPEAPRWPSGPAQGPRVLVEHPDPETLQAVERGLQERGYEVLTCSGPGAPGGGGIPCPVLRQERCPAITGADAVVTGLPLREPRQRMIVHRTLRDADGRPVIVEASHQDVEEHGRDAITFHLRSLTIQGLCEVLDAEVPTS